MISKNPKDITHSNSIPLKRYVLKGFMDVLFGRKEKHYQICGKHIKFFLGIVFTGALSAWTERGRDDSK